MRMRSRTRPSLALLASGSLAALVALAAVGACNNQGEGGVCDPASDDCQAGLQCQTFSGGPNRCCPVPPAQPTTQICAPTNQGVSGNVSPDSGSSSSGSSGGGDAEAGGASFDAASDAVAETSADAPAESSAVGAEAPDSPTE